MISLAEEPNVVTKVEMLRVCTAGSVDDGKSTLIGRLLYDSRAIPEDQYEAIKRATGSDEEAVNLALLTDGLRAEREQQITIDVAYRYFAGSKRRFILADTPGHAQYTRNMVTGASTAELAIVLVDARKGLLPQSKRHTIISSLLRVPHLLVAVNKMDLVAFDEGRFREIESAFLEFVGRSFNQNVAVIPVSALHGDNIVDRSERTPWHSGPFLLEHLESVPISGPERGALRFPVQCVIRPNQDFRGYAGELVSGHVSVGQEVVVFPNRIETAVTSIVTPDGPLQAARAGEAVVLTLADDLDISRGDLIAGILDEPLESSQFEVDLCWLGDRPHRPGKHYVVLHGTAQCGAVIEEDIELIDVETLNSRAANILNKNDIARSVISTFKPLHLDTYADNRFNGAMLLVDPDTNIPAAAAMVRKVSETEAIERFEI